MFNLISIEGRAFFFQWKINSSVFDSFSDNLLALSQATSIFSSLFITLSITFKSLLPNSKLVSSAKWWMMQLENDQAKSLM